MNNMIVIIILMFICCISIIVNVLSVLSYKNKNTFTYISSLTVIVVSLMLTGMGIIINETNGINPLDVYAGKTELQITYKIINNDTISCDSIVVFKNK